MAGFGNASRDIIDYMGGGKSPGMPDDMFTMDIDKSNYLELLARLLGEDKFKGLVADWHKDPKTGQPNIGAYENTPAYGAAMARGGRTVPSYIDPYTSKTNSPR